MFIFSGSAELHGRHAHIRGNDRRFVFGWPNGVALPHRGCDLLLCLHA